MLTSACKGNGRYAQFSGYAQGGTWGVKANLAGVRTSRSEIQRNIEAILEEIDTTLSGYNKSSQLSRLNAGDTIRPSAMLCEVYDAAWKFWQESDGALDCAAGPLYDIWGFGFKNGEMPSDEQVRQALEISGMKRLRPTMEEAMRDGRLWGPWLEKSSCSGNREGSDCARNGCSGSRNGGDCTRAGSNGSRDGNDCTPAGCKGSRDGDDCTRAGCKGSRNGSDGNAPATVDILVLPQLNFNAIAQGYSCDKVAAYLDGIGVKDMLVDIGEIWCRGLNPSGKPWRVGVDRPVDGNDRPGADMDGIWESGLLTGDGKQPGSDYGAGGLTGGQGIVTSGNYRKFYIRDGRKYSHTIDPRSGYPVGTAPSANSGEPFLKTGQNRNRSANSGAPFLKPDQNGNHTAKTGGPFLKSDQNRNPSANSGEPFLKPDQNGNHSANSEEPFLKSDQNRNHSANSGEPFLKSGQNRNHTAKTGGPFLKSDHNRNRSTNSGVPSLESGQIRDGNGRARKAAGGSGEPGSGTLLSATIVAPTAMAADAYATYCMVIGFEAARDFIESRPDLEGYLIVSTGATVWTDGSSNAAIGTSSTGNAANAATTSTSSSGNATGSTDSDMSEWASAGFKLSH